MADQSFLGRITFDAATEARYQARVNAQRMPLARIILLFGVASFLTLIFWDLYLDPAALPRTGPLRLGAAVAFAALYLISRTRLFGNRLIWLSLSAFAIALGAFGTVAALLPGGLLAGIGGMVMSLIYMPFVVSRMRDAVLVSAMFLVIPNVIMAVAGAPEATFVHMNAWMGTGCVFALGMAFLFDILSRRIFQLERSLEAEKERSDQLLLNVLPAEIAEELKREGKSASTAFESATVLFADLVGFTALSRTIDAERLVALLNDLFSRFDDLAAKHGVEKIKTIGDAYMAVVGVPSPRDDHARAMADLALDMQRAHADFVAEHKLDLGLRIGLHSGPVIAGVIGKTKFAYDLWGDTVNIASRMESQGVPGKIQLSRSAREALPEGYAVRPRGRIAVKGHRAMRTYLLEGKADAAVA